MARVPVELNLQAVERDDEDGGGTCPGVCVTCPRCDAEATACGQSDRSVARAVMNLKQKCPRGEDNWYFVPDDD
jgi:hypothetical protein